MNMLMFTQSMSVLMLMHLHPIAMKQCTILKTIEIISKTGHKIKIMGDNQVGLR